jgi:uncharacterized protein YidB (DUF937 family)
MFDEILNAVKEHLGNNPQVANAIPADQADAIHNEIATHVTNALSGQGQSDATGSSGGGGLSGLLGKLESEVTSGSPIVNAIGGGLVSSLASKFGLGPAATGAIAASLPGLLQKFAPKTPAQ